MKYLNSTLDQKIHKQPKENYMQRLTEKLGQLKKADYDKKIYSNSEIGKKINPETSRNLKLCEDFGIDASIIGSELIHTKEELEALESKTTSFRESGSNDEKIAELTELVSELEAAMKEKFDQAARSQDFKAKESKHAKALAALEPLAIELEEIEKKIKDNLPNIREVGNSVFDNTLNPNTFRLLHAMSKPGGVLN